MIVGDYFCEISLRFVKIKSTPQIPGGAVLCLVSCGVVTKLVDVTEQRCETNACADCLWR